jgi:osmoprotectant transport system substrate-binding protein
VGPTRLRRLIGAALLAAAAALGAGGAAAAAEDAVRVASKIDTEGALLGNLMLGALAARHIATVDKLGLGPTNLLRQAIIAGEIDLYPEYTGNGAIFYAMEGDPAWQSGEAGYEKIRALDAARHQLAWLAPAPADNRWAIALRKEVAATNKLVTMEDFSRWVTAGGRVRLAASAEFVESPAALPAFERVYGFTLKRAQILVLAGGNTPVMLRAAAEGISGVNAAMAYGTDGALAVLDLAVMSDPKTAQVVYAPAPVIRATVLERHPEIREALAPVFASLDDATLRRLNAEIAVDGEAAGAVAADYLRLHGFVR